MLKAGASAYLMKGCPFDELIRAINAVFKNHTYLSPNIADSVIEDYVRDLSLSKGAVSSSLTGMGARSA